MPLNNLLALLILFAPSVIGLACVPVFVIMLKKRGPRWAAGVLAFLAVESVLAALWTLNTSATGFGPGMWSLCLAPMMAFIALVLLLILLPSSFRALGTDRARCRWYLGGGALTVVLLLSPLIAYMAFAGHCDERSRAIANRIIDAAETYRRDHGSYPQGHRDLVPEYLQTWPAPACSWMERDEPVPYLSGFAVIGTPSGRFGFTLTVPSSRFGQVQVYDHATRQWRYERMLD